MKGFTTKDYYIGLLPLPPQKQKRVPFQRIEQGAGESARHRAQAADERTDAHRPHYAQQEVGRHERAGALQLRVRVRSSFAHGCRRPSRALAGALQLRARVQATFACACGCKRPSRAARAAFTHVQPSRTCA